jgi:hypothetical protein
MRRLARCRPPAVALACRLLVCSVCLKIFDDIVEIVFQCFCCGSEKLVHQTRRLESVSNAAAIGWRHLSLKSLINWLEDVALRNFQNIHRKPEVWLRVAVAGAVVVNA